MCTVWSHLLLQLDDSSAVWSTTFCIWEVKLWKGVIKAVILTLSCWISNVSCWSIELQPARSLWQLQCYANLLLCKVERACTEQEELMKCHVKLVIDEWKPLHPWEHNFQYTCTMISPQHFLLTSRKNRIWRFKSLSNEVSAACHSTKKIEHCKFFG